VRRFALSSVAIASLLIAVVLAGGYVARLSVDVSHMTVGSAVEVVDLTIRAEEGRLVFTPEWAHAVPIRWVAAYRLAAPGWRASWSVRPRGHSRPMRAIWEFDAHPLGPGYILAAPIWCFEAVCLMAPLLWVRARRMQSRAAHAEGFAVVAPA
jgi:hypothetical protein